LPIHVPHFIVEVSTQPVQFMGHCLHLYWSPGQHRRMPAA
jgi:hypothetical protein